VNRDPLSSFDTCIHARHRLTTRNAAQQPPRPRTERSPGIDHLSALPPSFRRPRHQLWVDSRQSVAAPCRPGGVSRRMSGGGIAARGSRAAAALRAKARGANSVSRAWPGQVRAP
jgi:hypothetical protein